MAARRKTVSLISAIGLALVSFVARPAHAAAPPAMTASERYASIVVDADTGQVVDSANADHVLHPASLTKIMTLYMTFEALKRGEIALKQMLPVSAHAASMTPTELGLKAGETITTEQAILGLVTKSANDAAVVLAEALGGTEAEFGRKMTERARSLGMTQSVFVNASGLPDPEQVSSARDMALLAMATLRDHRSEYRYFSTWKFTYRGRAYFNHNRLLGLYKGMDGIKTGFIRDSGYNLVASAVRDDRRVIGVVFGGSSGRARDAHMVALLDEGFRGLAQRREAAAVDAALTVRAPEPKQPPRLAGTVNLDFAPPSAPSPVAKAGATPAARAAEAGPVRLARKEPKAAKGPARTKLADAKRGGRVQMVAMR